MKINVKPIYILKSLFDSKSLYEYDFGEVIMGFVDRDRTKFLLQHENDDTLSVRKSIRLKKIQYWIAFSPLDTQGRPEGLQVSLHTHDFTFTKPGIVDLVGGHPTVLFADLVTVPLSGIDFDYGFPVRVAKQIRIIQYND